MMTRDDADEWLAVAASNKIGCHPHDQAALQVFRAGFVMAACVVVASGMAPSPSARESHGRAARQLGSSSHRWK